MTFSHARPDRYRVIYTDDRLGDKSPEFKMIFFKGQTMDQFFYDHPHYTIRRLTIAYDYPHERT